MSERIEMWSRSRLWIKLWGAWEMLLFISDERKLSIGIEWGTRDYPSVCLFLPWSGVSVFRRTEWPRVDLDAALKIVRRNAPDLPEGAEFPDV